MLTTVLFVAAAVPLVALEGMRLFAQVTLNGLVSGISLALGAVGLTLVYGVLRFVNFAQGDMLTFGAYLALAVHSLHLPFAAGIATAILGTAFLALTFETALWKPMRRKGAGLLPLFLMSLGVAFVLRYTIQFVAGSDARSVGANVTSVIALGNGLKLGRTELYSALAGACIILLLGFLLHSTSLGRQVRALSDNPELAETTGIDTARAVRITWLVSGGLAGLAGVLLAASIGFVSPQLGYSIVLSLFAAMIIGGIGNAYGALAGGLLIGVTQEWATLVINPSLKPVVGFSMMIIALILRPQGLLGWARATEL